jgi:hypothetical protein
MHKVNGVTWAEVGPLRRTEVEAQVLNYLEEGLHANLFLHWEVKRGTKNHPENIAIAKEFTDVLMKMGIVAA